MIIIITIERGIKQNKKKRFGFYKLKIQSNSSLNVIVNRIMFNNINKSVVVVVVVVVIIIVKYYLKYLS
jgi:hypothetical protein